MSVLRTTLLVAGVTWTTSSSDTPCGLSVPTNWAQLGSLQTRTSSQIASSAFSVGAECVDRNYTVYDAWQQHLNPLGSKWARIQAGWERCEPSVGNYDWAWLDEIVTGMMSQGVTPWIQTSYGNSAYGPDGGNPSSASLLPNSTQALAGWSAWVTALAHRYSIFTDTWEIWNEPNIMHITAAQMADFAVLTAGLIRSVQPSAVIRFGVTAGIDISYATDLLRNVSAQGADKLALFDVLTYHPYVYNPDTIYGDAAELQAAITAIAPGITIAQGENGAPSVPYTYGALGDYNWTQCSQAKWYTRRLLGDRSRGIPSSAFTIVDICYVEGGKPDINTKGLIEAVCPDKTVVAPKISYFTVQRIFSLFDSSMIPLSADNITISVSGFNASSVYASAFTPNDGSGRLLLALWDASNTPVNADQSVTNLYDINITTSAASSLLGSPLTSAAPWALVDTLTGNVYAVPQVETLPSTSAMTSTTTVSLQGVPISDFAVLVGDATLLPVQQR